MSYATATNLIDHCDSDELPPVVDRSIPRLVDDTLLGKVAAGADISDYTAEEQAAATASLARINTALADASQLVDGYCAARYAVPFDTPPSMVKRWTMDITRWQLYGVQVPETIQKRYDATIGALKSVARGDLSLGAPLGATEAPSGGSVVMESTTPVWQRDGNGNGGFI